MRSSKRALRPQVPTACQSKRRRRSSLQLGRLAAVGRQKDDPEYALDPDGEWYDEVLEADVGDVLEEAEVEEPKKKKKAQRGSP